MTPKWFGLPPLVVAGLLWFPMSVATAEEPVEINGRPAMLHRWDAFTVPYPAGRWQLAAMKEEPTRVYLHLTPMSDPDIVIQLTLVKGMPDADVQYRNNPQTSNVAVLLPPALELAEHDESNVHLSTGTVAVPSGIFTSARATITGEGGYAVHLEACHDFYEQSGHMMTALVMTRSLAGQVKQDRTYNETMLEAYEIIRSVTLKPAAK